MNTPIIGQEAICPQGLGRVRGIAEKGGAIIEIRIETHIDDYGCWWQPNEVQLVPIAGQPSQDTTKLEMELIRARSALLDIWKNEYLVHAECLPQLPEGDEVWAKEQALEKYTNIIEN